MAVLFDEIMHNIPWWRLLQKAVAKSIKALNHEEHEGHKGKEKLFFVLFVVYFFSESFATPSGGDM